MSDMQTTWKQRASELSDMADRESDRADTAERVIERLHMQLECERDLAERVIDNCTAAWERLVAQRDALKKAVKRIALSCPATQSAELLDAAEETAATSTAGPDGIRGKCCDCDEAVRKE